MSDTDPTMDASPLFYDSPSYRGPRYNVEEPWPEEDTTQDVAYPCDDDPHKKEDFYA